MSTRSREAAFGVAAAVGWVALASALGRTIAGPSQLANVAMAYLLSVILVSMRFGYGPSVFAAVLSAVAFDFLFIPPLYRLAVTDPRHLVTVGAMFVVAVVVSGLTQRVRREAEAARLREARAANLYALSRELAGARSIAELASAVGVQLGRVFDAASALFLPETDGEGLMPSAEGAGTFAMDEKERGVAEWVWQRERPAGLGTEMLPSAKALYLPLRASRGRVAVLGVAPNDVGRFHDPEQRQLLDTFGHQIALAIERTELARLAAAAKLQVETEQLRNALLSSVSHDLRSPLAVVKGAASALVEGADALSPAARRDLAVSIVDEADRLNRLVRNLLDMTRLEAGVLPVTKEWQSIEEVVGTALDRLEDRLRDRFVDTRLPADLPLLPFDAILIEQVLINLVENAARHTPAGTAIELSAEASATEVTVHVADRGPGVAEGEETKIFEKFYRGREGAGGFGLGLAICRGVVVAHGGRIEAIRRDGGGALFSFTLPRTSLDVSASMPEPEDEG